MFTPDHPGSHRPHPPTAYERKVCAVWHESVSKSVTIPGDTARGPSAMSPRKRDEPVRLTRIYTRGGDRGETSLGDGSRASKLDRAVGAYGAVDELNSQLGVVLALATSPGSCAAARTRPERALRRGRRSLRPLRRGRRAAAGHPGADRRARAPLRPVQRGAPRAEELRLPGGTEARRASTSRGPSAGEPSCAALAAAARGRDQPARARLPEPALRPALHPRPRSERRRRGAALEARRLRLASASSRF